MTRYTGIIDAYRSRMPLPADAKAISLGEGRTPLIKLDNLVRHEGVEADLYVKFEGTNPTGSFKDRGMTMAVTEAVHRGAKAILCASTGNTSAAAAAYAARAGIKSFVLIPEGKIAMGKLAQAVVHGATIVQVRGNFDDGMRLVKEVSETSPVALVNSVNPYRLQGQKTAAFEIVEALGRAPDYHCLPVGNAGNITAHWLGYSESAGLPTAADSHFAAHSTIGNFATVTTRPHMVGYQAAGSAPFMRGGPVKDPETVATAIRIGNPQSWDLALHVQTESKGWFDECTDAEILACQRLLAEQEGVFCEPASATSLAGALRDLKSGKIPAGSTVVCTLTGNGMKDPDIILKGGFPPMIEVDAVKSAVERVLVDRL
ncbi:threonine synthase [Nevskia sp.]|uniref:threonine synthase n=1 Tax=Nevskia sp. TaxID=1929292 RepID=UPI0025E55E90|nr:threonine synthase [Nevskia sp.]